MLIVKIFKHRNFAKWATNHKINDAKLVAAVLEISNGLYEANLGSGLYKKRIAKEGKGKSTGLRTLLAFCKNDKAIFIYGFSKNQRKNINTQELIIYRELAKSYLNLNNFYINKMLKNKILLEVKQYEG